MIKQLQYNYGLVLNPLISGTAPPSGLGDVNTTKS
jgi:hypothetical protein